MKGTNLTAMDNGNIFSFAKMAATKRKSSSDGDTFVPVHGYRAMISTLLWKTQGNRTFDDDFRLICDESLGVIGGCAMFSVQFNGAEDRSISIFNYQPGTTPSYNNSMYYPSVFEFIVKNPPVQLIENYYDCVYSPFKAFYLSAGVTASNTTLAVGVFMVLHMYSTVFFYRYICGYKHVEFKPMHLRIKKHKEKTRELFVERMMDNIREGKPVS